ncbi:ATP-binding protein, partial [uncultured Muribaculum sp.]
GKTHIATALGIEACTQGMAVMFTSVPRLITQIKETRQERALRSLENRFINYDLVICDEFGYVSCDKEAGELLFNHLSLRAGKKSIIITTNLAFNRWSEIIADKVLVTAMVDRLTHKALLINMTGESFRMKETKKILQNQL